MNSLVFEEVSVDVLRPLRTRVLRPQFPPGKLAIFEGDERDGTHHFVVRDEGEIVGCATFMKWPSPAHEGRPAIRLRGMAVATDRQSQGIGKRLLDVTMTRLSVLEPEHDILWCNARLGAVDFYEQCGFEIWGDEFEVAGIGPHFVMWRNLPKALAT